MKDFVLAEVQLGAAKALGADAVLLVATLFRRHLCDLSLRAMIRHAHDRGFEVLLEAYTRSEFEDALATEADVLGINNRDLRSMTVDLGNTERILRACPPSGRLVVSESGIETVADIRRLRRAGADGFLVGTSIMRAVDPEAAVRELVNLP
jgi:indole-3-glycerol phosphate synthase